MDHRGHPWPDPGHQYPHRTKDREDYSRYPQQEWDQSCPTPDPRERDRPWAHPDARYSPHYASPPVRPEQYPSNYQQYAYGHGRADHQRPQSRHGYDYPPHSHWDYRDNYGYYDQDYYRGQHGRQDAAQRTPQESRRADGYHDRNYKQEHSGSSYLEDNRYAHLRDNSQRHINNYEETPSRENEEVSSYHLGTLESSKTSGLSSSCYELSQYIDGSEHSDSVPPTVHASDEDHGAVHQTSAPLKYSVPHAVVSFGPAGQLIRVAPGFSTQKNFSQLEIHSLEVILSETQEQQEMRNFPGPLTREDLHKVDAMDFAQKEAGACIRDEKLQDKSSAALLWNLLILLCRQNGQIVGSDIAELLMQGSRSDGSWEIEAPTLIDFSEGTAAEAPPQTGDDLLMGSCSFSSETSEKALHSYTELLLAGRKKEALESAMSSGLWGHALFLASKMDSRSYTSVLNRFTGQLTASDPLQTLFQLLSGRIPAVATCCGNEKRGDWRPHLAVMLSNETGDPAVQRKAIITTGDTLASRRLLHAAHVCYLTAGVPFGAFTQKAERLVLLGSSHRQPFEYFATNSAIQCTELYEYCLTLGEKSFSIPSFQTGSYDCTETYQPEPEVCALAHDDSEVYSGLDDLNRDILSPEPELLYYRGNEDQESLLNQTEASTEEMLSSYITGAQHWPGASPPLPVTMVNAPPLSKVAQSQDFSYHNTDSAEVRSALTHCPPSDVPSAGGGAWSFSGTGKMPEADISHQGYDQQRTQERFKPSEQTNQPREQGTKVGWFSGWFKSKPNDVQKESSEQRSTAQMEQPPTTGPLCRPPPAAMVSLNTFPSQPSSAAINPFSRKAV
ncbi:protein transport protein Sec16B isoform X3 [Platichthys flesus]|uniref:protein transport protein Sec16B isoform X3 n=1 Tax=Platichthys flesus TaxID=8260 RepID=UPI002DB6A039|nr:protein transport protein Sec16B isoform X3 [Platichthys flesus]